MRANFGAETSVATQMRNTFSKFKKFGFRIQNKDNFFCTLFSVHRLAFKFKATIFIIA